MSKNDIASVTLGTIYALIVAQQILWLVVPAVVAEMSWVLSTIATGNFHPQSPSYYLTSMSIAEPFESSIDRFRV